MKKDSRRPGRAEPSDENHGFIPADESRFILFAFGLYVRWLFKRRFHAVHIHQDYRPGPDSRTLYYLNHTTWWDGILPLLLNQTRFRQQARAMMEDKQMRQYGVFRKIGAFSVSLSDPRHALRSLRYALESMRRPNACLFIYPEGRIHADSGQLPAFRDGVGWITRKGIEEGLAFDVVPIAVHLHCATASKPELHVRVGPAVDVSGLDGLTSQQVTMRLHEHLQHHLTRLRQEAHPAVLPAVQASPVASATFREERALNR